MNGATFINSMTKELSSWIEPTIGLIYAALILAGLACAVMMGLGDKWDQQWQDRGKKGLVWIMIATGVITIIKTYI